MNRYFLTISTLALCGIFSISGATSQEAHPVKEMGHQIKEKMTHVHENKSHAKTPEANKPVHWEAIVRGEKGKEVRRSELNVKSIKNEKDYETIWSRIQKATGTKAPRPHIDFTKESLVIVKAPNSKQPFIQVTKLTITKGGKVEIHWLPSNKEQGGNTYYQFAILKVDVPHAGVRYRRDKEAEAKQKAEENKAKEHAAPKHTHKETHEKTTVHTHMKNK